MENKRPDIRPDDGDDITMLRQYLEANPDDNTAMLALADAIYEVRGTYETALRIAANVKARAGAALWRRQMNEILMPYTVDEIDIMLAGANGNRSTRLLTVAEIIDAAKLARSCPTGNVLLLNKPVRHPLPTPSTRTQALVACRKDGELRVAIARVSAARNACILNYLGLPTPPLADSDIPTWAEWQPKNVRVFGSFSARLAAAIHQTPPTPGGGNALQQEG